VAERKPSEESEWTARDKAFVVLIAAVLLGGGLL
jgi:hypothetical protein